MGSSYDQDLAEGFTAYHANRKREAALLFAQAKEAARLNGEAAKGFKAGFWEVSAVRDTGEYQRAYALLFALLADAPPDAPAYECWLAKSDAYLLWCALEERSSVARKARLEQLQAVATRLHGVAPGDLPELWAYFAEDSGNWVDALRSYETAWTVHDEANCGFYKCGKAFGALAALLRLGRPQEAARWLALLAQTEQDRAYGRLYLHRAQAALALYGGEPLAPVCRSLEQDLIGTQADNNADVRHLLARLYLLLRPGEDPAERYHPARALLRQRPEAGRNWDRFLTLADFRLGAVRFAAGVPPCDDDYYCQPQDLASISAPPDADDFVRRVRRARLAVAHLQKMAEKKDQLNECTWYTSQAAAREARLVAIEQAVAACRAV
jgi:hypothetical protein